MRWFPRARASRFPADMTRRLEMLGRHFLDSRTSGLGSAEVWSTCIGPFLTDGRDNHLGFLTDLRAVVASDRGGFATCGAAALVWEVHGGDALHAPPAWPLIDAGIDFKLLRGLPTASLTGYEMQRLTGRRATAGPAPLHEES